VSNDNVIQYLNSNQLDKLGVVFNGHLETIKSIDLSHDCTYLLSASSDKTCKLWSLKKPFDMLFDIQSLKIKNADVSLLSKFVLIYLRIFRIPSENVLKRIP
jgi:WD40 repeat protein